MTNDNALKAMTLASVVPILGVSAGAVQAGLAAGSGMQVARGLATGLAAASSVAPSLGPTAAVAGRASSLATAASDGMVSASTRRRAQGPMTAQAYLNDYGLRLANPSWGTQSQYATAQIK